MVGLSKKGSNNWELWEKQDYVEFLSIEDYYILFSRDGVERLPIYRVHEHIL